MEALLFENTYLPQKNLEHLKRYQYHGQDRSILSFLIYRHMWSAVVDYIPMWIAPNAITLVGFSLSFACYALLMFYTPMMDREAPSWVYI
jgi:ethanolaminephosphotransferase